jgi:hypothetical protein
LVQLKGVVECLFTTPGPSIWVVFESVIIPIPSVVVVRIQKRETDTLEKVEAKLK